MWAIILPQRLGVLPCEDLITPTCSADSEKVICLDEMVIGMKGILLLLANVAVVVCYEQKFSLVSTQVNMELLAEAESESKEIEQTIDTIR